jgi:hypothetical protein
MNFKVLVITFVLSGGILPLAQAGDLPDPRVIKIAYGVTRVDFTNDGKADLVVLGHRENFNAHSFDVASFYVYVAKGDIATGDADIDVWDIVPIMGEKGEQFEVTISGGADCVLHDFRLLKGTSKDPPTLIVADRKLVDSYYESQEVTFKYYLLKHSAEGNPGEPRYSFQLAKPITAKGRFCDVGEAFRKELGLGDYRQEM